MQYTRIVLKPSAFAFNGELPDQYCNQELVKKNFFEYLDFALQFAPAQENEKEIRAQLASIGIGPGKTMNFKDLSLEDKLEIGLGVKEGDRKVDEAVANAGKSINGWRVSSLPGNSAHYNGDWLMRATAARAGIYGNDAVEAMYPLTRVDGDGQTLDGSKHNYVLTFPAGQQPPVNSFWSLTMYDGKRRALMNDWADYCASANIRLRRSAARVQLSVDTARLLDCLARCKFT
jgi:hypothetical protein